MSALRVLVGLTVVAAFAGAGPALAQAPTQNGASDVAAAPAVGDVAPDFTAPGADATGALAKPLSLEQFRGKVVVLAFYPGDRTRGCTAELSKFRDEYATLFGDGVVVLPISVDGIESHASWAKDMHFPFVLLSDPAQEVSSKYGSAMPGRKVDSRTVFVIGRDGRITFSNTRFGALNEDAYRELAAAVAKAKG